MLKEEKFEFDIDNIKKDLAVEDLYISENVIDLLKQCNNNEITIDRAINLVINNN